jgi:phosphatidylglycerol:prolipoprotein diacylglycerol transferase
MWTTCDVFAPGIALGHAIGRFGCLMAGCCYGRPTTKPWGITFHEPFAAANVGTPLEIALHPTQLYEAGAELLILAVLLATERRGRPFPDGRSGIHAALCGVVIIEHLRRRAAPSFGVPSTSFVSVILAPPRSAC